MRVVTVAVMAALTTAAPPAHAVATRAPRLYFLDVRGGRVVSANTDGSDLKTLVTGLRGTPDGIVVDARFVAHGDCGLHLEKCQPWVREPLGAWLDERWAELRSYRYQVDGDQLQSITVVRIGP